MDFLYKKNKNLKKEESGHRIDGHNYYWCKYCGCYMNDHNSGGHNDDNAYKKKGINKRSFSDVKPPPPLPSVVVMSPRETQEEDLRSQSQRTSDSYWLKSNIRVLKSFKNKNKFNFSRK